MNDLSQSNGLSGGRRLIESDSFALEFVSELAEMESWRKEVHRPIYHIHKWWAKRLGSVFRAILLGSGIAGDGETRGSLLSQPRFQQPDCI